MRIVKFVKNKYVKGILRKLTEGNTGSTVIGAIAVMLLSMDIDFDAVGLLLSGEVSPKHIGEIAKLIAGIVLGFWAWRTGREKKSDEEATSTKP